MGVGRGIVGGTGSGDDDRAPPGAGARKGAVKKAPAPAKKAPAPAKKAPAPAKAASPKKGGGKKAGATKTTGKAARRPRG